MLFEEDKVQEESCHLGEVKGTLEIKNIGFNLTPNMFLWHLVSVEIFHFFVLENIRPDDLSSLSNSRLFWYSEGSLGVFFESFGFWKY